MRNHWLAVLLACVSLLTAVGARAQGLDASSMDVLRKELELDKKDVIKANLVLTDAEAAKFWPVYENYQKELQAIDERVVRLVNEYADSYKAGSVSDTQAQRFIREAIAVDEAEVALRKRTARRLEGAIPAIEAARYLQIENKIRAVIMFDLADLVPLVE